MCGIAGVFSADRPAAQKAVRAMNRRQTHRGPDDEGLQALDVPGGTLVLGHRRLSILDLSQAGHQPMRNPETGDWIVYNGEIYNYPDLRLEMETDGTWFRSRCDTEAILHSYVRWGTECFDHFHGMFSVAIYDRRRRRLVLARDPLGIKPLYYSIDRNGLIFSSELRAFKVGGLIDCEIDRRAMAGLLAYGSVPGPLTMFKNVKLLEPGTWGLFDLSREPGMEKALKTTRYWNFPAPLAIVDRNEAVEETRERLETSARSHLLSDVPVGIFLSSGLDSTAVATLCAQTEPDAVNTFTIRLADHPEMDENPVAEETARLIGAKHHSVSLVEEEIQGMARQWLGSVDQPSVDGLNTFIISNAVSGRGMKVALSGLGGDEVFGGYNGFRTLPNIARWAKMGRIVPAFLRGKIAEMLLASKSMSQRQKGKELVRTRPTLRNLTLRRRRLFSDLEMEILGFDPVRLDLNEDYLPCETEPSRGLRGLDAESAIGVLETRFYMGNMLLRDSDVFGMAHSLEIRVPFLDRGVIDYVYSLPGRWRVIRDGVNKPLLAEALGERLRPEILHLKKRGFSLPIGQWMVGPLRDHCESLLWKAGDSEVVDPSAVRTVWEGFLAEPGSPAWSRAWLLIVFGAWLDQFDAA